MTEGQSVRQRHVALLREKKEAEKVLRRVKDDLAKNEPLVIESLIEAGEQSVKVDGMTLFFKTRTWAKPCSAGERASDEEYARACEALKAEGWGGYVAERFNVTSLSSAVSEAKKSGEIEIVQVEGEASKFLAFGGTILVEDKTEIGHRSS